MVHETLVKKVAVPLVVVAAALMVFVLVTPPVGAAGATPTNGTATGTWSYGAAKTVNVGPVRASDGWDYEGTLTIGYTVTVYQNNTSSNTFELTVFRTIGASFSLHFCSPSCSSPLNWVNLTYRAFQNTAGFSNFTTAGTVVENDQNVPAVALLNSTVFLDSNVTESSVEHLPVLHWLGDHDYYLAAQIVGDAAINFAPSLGLFPLNLTPGSSWSATSAFSLAGSVDYSYYYSAHFPLRNTTIGPVSGPVTFARNGNVTVLGSYGIGNTVTLGGVVYPAIDLTIVGPLTVIEGVIFLPNAADLFSGSNNVAENASASTNFAQSAVDAKFLDGSFHLGASSWRYSTDSQNPADQLGAAQALPTGGILPAAATANPVSSSTVQGQPETQADASSTGQCLTTGTNCPAANGSGGTPRGLFADVIVAGAVATVAVLVALAVVSRRRSLPPPAYPNAVLYPPGSSAAPGTPRTPGGTTPEAPSEEGPLDHLW